MKEILFFDIDSTLYSHSLKKVPDSAIQALIKLKSLNKKCFIATSRSYQEISNIDEVIPLIDGMVVEGGAKIIYQNKVIIQHVMDEKDKNHLIDLLHHYDLAYRYCGKGIDINYLHKKDALAFSRFDTLYGKIPVVKPYTNQELTHILFYCLDHSLALKIIKDCPCLEFIDLKDAFEVTNAKITKGFAIEEVCQYFNIPLTKSVCFGDSNNDIQMIKTAQLGIAMGNGCQNVKDVANFVTKSIDEDGIYYACEYFNWFD